MEHESEQTTNLCFPGHQLQENPCEPDRLLGQIPAALVNPRQVIPADPEGCIDCLKHRVEPLRQVPLVWDLELNTAVTAFRRSTHQTLTHRCRRDQERVSNTGRIEAQNG